MTKYDAAADCATEESSDSEVFDGAGPLAGFGAGLWLTEAAITWWKSRAPENEPAGPAFAPVWIELSGRMSDRSEFVEFWTEAVVTKPVKVQPADQSSRLIFQRLSL